MKNLLLLLTISIFFIGCSKTETIDIVEIPPKAKVTNMILKVPIYLKDNGYNNFKTILITDKGKLDKFLKEIKTQKGWDKKENFLDTLSIQNIDFNKQNLLIYRITENSSAIVLAVNVPTVLKNHARVIIGKEKPKSTTTDMAYYALAYLVDKKIEDITFDDGDSNSTVKNNDL
jgi:hypothetical protein